MNESTLRIRNVGQAVTSSSRPATVGSWQSDFRGSYQRLSVCQNSCLIDISISFNL